MRSRPKLFLSLPSLGMSLVSAPPCLPPTETNRLFCALKASVWQVLAKCCHFLGCQWPLFWLLLCPQLWWAGFLHLPVLTMPSSDISQLPVAAVGLGFAGAMEGGTVVAPPQPCLRCLLGCAGEGAAWHQEQFTGQ